MANDMYPYYESDWSILPAEGNRRMKLNPFNNPICSSINSNDLKHFSSMDHLLHACDSKGTKIFEIREKRLTFH
uniref:CSON012097 protein n=1 Tax=Culicoides sonorensis TaxID=179676 RepID=A0A336KIW3_CULSO